MSAKQQRKGLTYQHQASLDLEKVKIDDPIPVVKIMGRPLEWTVEKIDALADELYEWLKNPSNMYLNRFLISKGLVPIYADRFCERSEYFGRACTLAKAYQEQKLVELAVSRKGDGNFIKFMLCAKSGWKDTSTINHNLNPLVSILDKISAIDDQPIMIELTEEPEATRDEQSGVVASPILPNNA